MQLDVIFSAVQRILQEAPQVLDEWQKMRAVAYKLCASNFGPVEVELRLLPGPCMVCGHPRFFVLFSGRRNHLSVHCPGCGWSVTFADNPFEHSDRLLNKIGTWVILLADLLCLGTVRTR